LIVALQNEKKIGELFRLKCFVPTPFLLTSSLSVWKEYRRKCISFLNKKKEARKKSQKAPLWSLYFSSFADALLLFEKYKKPT